MITYYNVEIQMSGTHKTTDHFISQVATSLGARETDIDEREEYRAVIFFKSDVKPTEMRKRVQAVLAMYSMTLHYIDVVYRYDQEMKPDRFCCWADGRIQEYTGKIIFTEDE